MGAAAPAQHCCQRWIRCPLWLRRAESGRLVRCALRRSGRRRPAIDRSRRGRLGCRGHRDQRRIGQNGESALEPVAATKADGDRDERFLDGGRRGDAHDALFGYRPWLDLDAYCRWRNALIALHHVGRDARRGQCLVAGDIDGNREVQRGTQRHLGRRAHDAQRVGATADRARQPGRQDDAASTHAGGAVASDREQCIGFCTARHSSMKVSQSRAVRDQTELHERMFALMRHDARSP